MSEKEYIERGALIENIKNMPWKITPAAEISKGIFLQTVEDAPAADVVEVVRCKDCIYNNGACTNSEIYDDTNYNPDYYCADGKRKEQT